MKGDEPWRIGGQVGRTIYDAHDDLIGVMDTRELAQRVVVAINAETIPLRAWRCPRCTAWEMDGEHFPNCPVCGTPYDPPAVVV